jgi:type IV pilus assembly protein PilF
MKQSLLVLGILGLLSACSVQVFEGERKVDPIAGARARVAIAAEYIQKGQPELALQHLQRALEQDPKSFEAHNVMGVLLEQDDNFEKAEQSYQKALSLNSDYPQARNNYGILLFNLKRYKEAMAQFEVAANDLSYERREVALDYMGRSALMFGQKDKAYASFERLLKLSPRMPEPALILAQLAFDDKKYDDAARYYQKHLRNLAKERQSASALWLGIRLARLKKDIDTIASYELVLREFYPQSPEYQEHLKTRP